DPGAATETFQYEWDFHYNGLMFQAQANGPDTTHAFAQVGIYQVALRVTDSNGAAAISRTSVTVTNVSPTAHAGPNQTLPAGSTASFHGSATDPGLPAETLTYEWDFAYNGSQFHAQAAGQDVSHPFLTPGTYAVALRVTDASGDSGLSVTT